MTAKQIVEAMIETNGKTWTEERLNDMIHIWRICGALDLKEYAEDWLSHLTRRERATMMRSIKRLDKAIVSVNL